ncbi:MAG: antiviral reverse transcriptase Drt2 [Bacteroidota bacterium]
MFTTKEFEEYWKDWSEQEMTNYKITKNKLGISTKKYLKKGYTHFDLRFWFPERKDELKELLKNKLRYFHKKHKIEEWWAFSPFLKVLIKTPRYKYQEEEGHYDLEDKIRPICFASHIDSLIFGFYAYALTKKYETYIETEGFSDCSLAYRSNLDGKCNIQFSKEVFDEIKRKGSCTAIALDIKGYFDHIDHKILKEKWLKILGEERLPEDQFKLYKTLTQYSYVNKNSVLKKYNVVLKNLNKQPQTLLEFIPGNINYQKFEHLRNDKLIVTNKKNIGIPQGSGMSALLSNIYLIDFDKDLNKKAKNEGFYYRRYCDDILIVCDSDRAEELQEFAIEKINKEYLLTIQNKKVEITEFRANSKNELRAFNKKKELQNGIKTTDKLNEKFYYKSLQYLGFEFNGQNIFIRTSSLSRYFRKMKGRIIKTVVMAYSKNGKDDKIWKRQIFERYTHLGKRNFLTYAYNAAKSQYTNSKNETKIGMDSSSIKKQLARHIDILKKTLGKKNNQRFLYKEYKGKASIRKKI